MLYFVSFVTETRTGNRAVQRTNPITSHEDIYAIEDLLAADSGETVIITNWRRFEEPL